MTFQQINTSWWQKWQKDRILFTKLLRCSEMSPLRRVTSCKLEIRNGLKGRFHFFFCGRLVSASWTPPLFLSSTLFWFPSTERICKIMAGALFFYYLLAIICNISLQTKKCNKDVESITHFYHISTKNQVNLEGWKALNKVLSHPTKSGHFWWVGHLGARSLGCWAYSFRWQLGWYESDAEIERWEISGGEKTQKWHGWKVETVKWRMGLNVDLFLS